MAGDWIKIEHALPSKPEVMQMAASLGCNEMEVVGHLVCFWSWVDQNMSAKCPVVTGTKSGLDRVAGRTGFADAMIDVGWLTISGANVSVPNYEDHLSKSSKARALEAKRKRIARSSSGQMSGSEPDTKPDMTRTESALEERREEKTIRPPIVPRDAGDVTKGQDADASSEDQPPTTDRDVVAEGFRQFWGSYPKRAGEDAARKAFTKAVGRAQQERGNGRDEAIQHLTNKAGEFAASPRGQGEFCPDASSWLKDGRWKDDPATWQVPQPATVIGSATDTGAREAWQQFRAAAKLWNPADAARCRKARDSLPPEVMEIVDSLGGFRQFCNADHKGANQFMSEFMIAWNDRHSSAAAMQ